MHYLIQYIKKLNWDIFLLMLLVCNLGALSNTTIPTISSALIFGTILGTVVGLILAVVTKE